MEITDLQIDVIHQVCPKTNLPVFITSAGKHITILCCCSSFTEHMKKELTGALGEETVKDNFHFRTGYLEYV